MGNMDKRRDINESLDSLYDLDEVYIYNSKTREKIAQGHTFKIEPTLGNTDYSAETNDQDNQHLVECINIKVPSKYDIHSILHEVGHFLGYRGRMDIRKEIMITLFVATFCKSVLEFQKNRKCEDQEDLNKILYDDFKENLYYEKQSDFSELDYVLEKFLSDDEYFSQNALNNHLLEHVNSLIYKQNSKLVFATWLEAELLCELKEHLKSNKDNFPAAVRLYIEDNYTGLLDKVLRIHDCLSEPTADCYMAALTQMGPEEYLNWVLAAEWNYWKKNEGAGLLRIFTLKKFVEFSLNEVFRTRVFSVYYALKKSTKVKKDSKKLLNYQGIGIGLLFIGILKKIFKRKYSNYVERMIDDYINYEEGDEIKIVQDIMDNLPAVAKYIYEIYEINYDKLDKSNDREKVKEYLVNEKMMCPLSSRQTKKQTLF